MTASAAGISRHESTTRSRYNALAEFQRNDALPMDMRQIFRTLGGVAMSAGGLGMSIWVIYLLHTAVFRPEKLGLLDRLVSPLPADLVMTIPTGRIELPPAILPVIAYLLLVALVAIGGRVAAALVKEGAWLLRHDPPSDPSSDPSDKFPAPVPLSTSPPAGG